MLYAIVSVLVILADQLIKLYVSADGFKAMELIPGFLNLTKVENTGGAFGLLGGEIPTYWFIIIAGVFTVLVVIALATRFVNGWLARWSLVLVTAGGISNCIDRVINIRPTGHVVDMFQFAFWKSFPVFNLADIFISVFCIVFILAILFGRDQKDQGAEDDEFVADEEEDEEPEEELRPARKTRKALKALEEEDEEEELVRPAKGRTGRKARQSKYDEEYEQYKAAQRAREEAAQAAAPAPVEVAPAEEPAPVAPAEEPSFDPADPFAEWERANAARQTTPAFVPAAPAEVVEEPVRPAKRSELKAEPEVAAPAAVQPEVPVQTVRPARRPAPAPVVEEPASFDLDDILAEFK